ncbi:urease accessory protein [Paucimonas lemoignei]|uniref:Urease accessory protein n=1 Tax=Paucimonas lemoignei TaxID=29443 RepID=A0A4R3HYJ0_PAULE|nr:HupE/UreJ family protein [Paucimonas lemoignei]TCS38437.1 urease accessory protein [Paucimonas lemoignei]
MSVHFTRAVVLLATLVFSGAALAHPGHAHDAHGAVAGMLHPLMGLDHLLAMLAIGIWAARLGGHARWLVPGSFVACMLVAAGLAMAGIDLPMMETGIALSVLLSGLLLALSVKVSPVAGMIVVACFAFFHGYAHGVEMPVMASPWLYAGGFTLTTAVLHGMGVLTGTALSRRRWTLPAVGTAIAACGGWMLTALA